MNRNRFRYRKGAHLKRTCAKDWMLCVDDTAMDIKRIGIKPIMEAMCVNAFRAGATVARGMGGGCPDRGRPSWGTLTV